MSLAEKVSRLRNFSGRTLFFRPKENNHHHDDDVESSSSSKILLSFSPEGTASLPPNQSAVYHSTVSFSYNDKIVSVPVASAYGRNSDAVLVVQFLDRTGTVVEFTREELCSQVSRTLYIVPRPVAEALRWPCLCYPVGDYYEVSSQNSKRGGLIVNELIVP